MGTDELHGNRPLRLLWLNLLNYQERVRRRSASHWLKDYGLLTPL